MLRGKKKANKHTAKQIVELSKRKPIKESNQRTSAARRLISGEKEGKGHLLFDYRNQRTCQELRGNFGVFSKRQCPKKTKKEKEPKRIKKKKQQPLRYAMYDVIAAAA